MHISPVNEGFLCLIGTLNFILNAMKIPQSILRRGMTIQMCLYEMKDVKQGTSVVSSIFSGL